MRAIFGWLGLSLALSGCSFFEGNNTVDALKSRQQRWLAQGITSYSFDLRRSCFCGGPHVPVRIVVRDRKIVSATPVQPTDQPVPDWWARTIDQLFSDLLETAQDADEMILDFDNTYHFMTSVIADPIKNAIDDEFSIAITNFQPMR